MWCDYEVVFFVVTKQLCFLIVCLFPKLSPDIKFRMMDAIFGLMISNVLNCYFLRLFVVSLFWVVLLGWREKRISIPKKDFYFLVASLR